MILIGVVLVGISGFSSYAIFTSEVTSPNEIRGVVVENKKSLVDTIKSKEGQDGLRKIEQEATTQMTATTEYRYSGDNDFVNNYINFNNETWRIIGVFEVEDENGKKEERVKIIREKPLEVIKRYGGSRGRWTYYPTDSNYSYYYLNNDYYNTISETYKKLIGQTKYYLGGSSSYSSTTASQFYTIERGAAYSTSYPQNIVTNVGLMYASDYGYAADSSCDSTYISSFSTDCYSKDWLYTSVYTNGSNYTYTGTSTSAYEWFLTANTSSSLVESVTSYYANVLTVNNGILTKKSYSSNYLIRPTLYLKSNTIVYSGDGTKEFPFSLIDTVKRPDVSGANRPLLSENMIPVYYDETEEIWKKADAWNTNLNYQWYNYGKKLWANAVTVSADNRSVYLSADPGTTISMDDINTMWVWIPRYKYTYFDSSTPSQIPITFERGTSSTGTIQCVDTISANSDKSETCTDSINGGLIIGKSTYTHPAFTFGDQELEGIWVGKFENGSVENPNDCSNNGQTNRTIIIKPGVKSLAYTALSFFSHSSRRMELKDNIYGFSQSGTKLNEVTGEIENDSNKLDTHMMKNMEWGAISYLSHSKYGLYDDGFYNSLGNNNYLIGMSGCGSLPGSDYITTACNSYQTVLGRLASTTQNIYGVYDMNGGLQEVVMGNVYYNNNQFNPSVIYNVPWELGKGPLEKYYDKYSYGTSDTRGKLGDATIEIYYVSNGSSSSWYKDYHSFPSTSVSWLLRGTSSSMKSVGGLFSYTDTAGECSQAIGSRSVLSIFSS